MRAEFAQSMIEVAADEKLIFMTGDLGYMALEKVRDAFGARFINAGVAEQNMVTMSAACAHEGLRPWVYSIAPFVTLRPYEQIRNDVCLHDLHVKLVGNGGGYGYGIMGGTHHNLEDIGAMRLLPNMKVWVPYNQQDVFEVVKQMQEDPHPGYLRLNLAAKNPQPVASFSQWRKLKDDGGACVVATGPVAENIFALPEELLSQLSVWLVSTFPLQELPVELVADVKRSRKVFTMEEHYSQGSLRETFAAVVINYLEGAVQMESVFATGYPSGRYGSQPWHQTENKLRGEGLELQLRNLLNS